MEPIGNNIEGIKTAQFTTPKTQQKQNDNQLKNFQNIEWKNKNDGKTYMAKKLTLVQDGKEITGVFVFDKSAKPDKNGDINGEFMNFDAFMKKLASEIPAVNSSMAQSYFPNIKYTSVGKAAPAKPAENFDDIFENSLKLSDGSMIIKPIIAGSSNSIKKDENGKYYLTSRPSIYGAEAHTREITEEEILNPRTGLSAGTIKKLDDGNYEVNCFKGTDEQNASKIMSGDECAKFLQNNSLYYYKIQQ